MRPYLICLVGAGAEGASPENSVSGVVEAAEYHGTYGKVTLVGVSGEELTVNEPDRTSAQSPAEAGEPIIATGEPPGGCSPPIGEPRAAPPSPRPKH